MNDYVCSYTQPNIAGYVRQGGLERAEIINHLFLVSSSKSASQIRSFDSLYQTFSLVYIFSCVILQSTKHYLDNIACYSAQNVCMPGMTNISISIVCMLNGIGQNFMLHTIFKARECRFFLYNGHLCCQVECMQLLLICSVKESPVHNGKQQYFGLLFDGN